MKRWAYIGGSVVAAALLGSIFYFADEIDKNSNPNLAMVQSGETLRKIKIKDEVSKYNSFISDAATKEYKLQAMSESAFTFYRATAHLYYEDIESGVITIPNSWKSTQNITTWIQGDLHTQNFGYFENNKGTAVFGINDFDESYMAPFYWDLIRYAASIHLMRKDTGFSMSKSDADEVVMEFLESYQKTLEEVNGNSDETTKEITSQSASGFVDDRLEKLKKEYTNKKLLDKWTLTSQNGRKFNMENSELQALDESFKFSLKTAWSGYVAQTGKNFSAAKYFDIKDVVKRLKSGLGSQGVIKLYVLIEGGSSSDEDDVILEVKEQLLPSMFYIDSMNKKEYEAKFAKHSDRVVTATKAMLNNTENHVGTVVVDDKSYSIKRISPYKYGYDAADFKSKTELKNYAKYCGVSVALSHAMADDDYKNGAYIGYNFEKGALEAIAKWSKAKTAIAELGKGYAERVEKDYELFLSLLANDEL